MRRIRWRFNILAVGMSISPINIYNVNILSWFYRTKRIIYSWNDINWRYTGRSSVYRFWLIPVSFRAIPSISTIRLFQSANRRRLVLISFIIWFNVFIIFRIITVYYFFSIITILIILYNYSVIPNRISYKEHHYNIKSKIALAGELNS